MLSTKNVRPQEGNVPKTLQPGTVKAHVYDIQLQPGYNADSYHLMIYLEGEPVGEGFQGFLRDKDDPNKGNFEGQVGRVKFSQWAYEDKVLPKTGQQISRDHSIIQALMRLCTAQGTLDQLNDINANDIEEFVEKARPIVSNDTYMYFTIGGREYKNKEGYMNFDLHLVKPAGKKYSVAADEGDVVPFEALTHIVPEKKKTAEGSESFEPQGDKTDFTF